METHNPYLPWDRQGEDKIKYYERKSDWQQEKEEDDE